MLTEKTEIIYQDEADRVAVVAYHNGTEGSRGGKPLGRYLVFERRGTDVAGAECWREVKPTDAGIERILRAALSRP
jgi:hypothetical protein